MPRKFKYSIHVPYAHIDKMGIVYYSNYFIYFEMARASFLREVGMPYGDMESHGVMLPVVEAHCDYKMSARYDDLLEVNSTCSLKGVRLHVAYEVTRGEDLIVTGYTNHVCMSPDGKIMRPTEELSGLVG
ncbi:acyl-CoA thioesterase [PVC group bacterium]|nr:acyl-CoA thioesterase [PVC group bacterium]